MNDFLKLPVSYNGKDCEYSFKIVAQGYVRRFAVFVEEVEVIFEKDDQGEYRALVYNPEEVTRKLPEAGLLTAIISVIQELTG